MRSSHRLAWVLALGALCAGLATSAAWGAEAGSLYQQSLAMLLARQFASPDLSYLMIDANTGAVLAVRWERPEDPSPLGSLVKPFTALAYAETHDFRYPSYECRGAVDGCWLPGGHGHIDIQQAVAGSCNVYFRKLASEAGPDGVSAVARRLGMPVPATLTGATLIGLNSDWRVAPLAILRAYAQLALHSSDPGVRELLEGMELSAEGGTAGAIGGALRGTAGVVPRVLAKTGTARCIHRHKAPGDGYVVALWPAASPRFALLVGVHGVPGARAAVVCGQMLRILTSANRQY